MFSWSGQMIMGTNKVYLCYYTSYLSMLKYVEVNLTGIPA